MRTRDYITTYSGHAFSPLAPDADAIDLRDVAHALARIGRANGHFADFYSVGQHSLNCAAEAKARGLIHLAASCRRGARKSSERAVPRAAAVDKKPVSHCPAGKSGISVNKDSAPGARCVSSRPSAWKQSHEGRGESRGHLRTTLSDDQQRSIRGAETERLAVG